MNTRFQISRTLGSSMLTRWAASRPPPTRSKCSSEQGPQGPWSPISQKLSLAPKGSTLSVGRCCNLQVGAQALQVADHRPPLLRSLRDNVTVCM